MFLIDQGPVDVCGINILMFLVDLQIFLMDHGPVDIIQDQGPVDFPCQEGT